MLTLHRTLSLLAVGSLAAGIAHLVNYSRRRGRATAPPLQTWETEGGAVPVSADQIAAQVAPRTTPQTSSPAGGTTPEPPTGTPGQYH